MGAETEESTWIEKMVDSILSGFSRGIDEPIKNGINNFIDNSAGLITALVTLYLALLGWRLMTAKLDGKQAGQELVVLFLTLGFFYKLPDAIPTLSNMIDNGPVALANLFLTGFDQSTTGSALAGVVATPWVLAYNMIVQPDVSLLSMDFSKMFFGAILFIVVCAILITTIAIVFVNTLKLKFMFLALPLFVILFLFGETRKLTEGYVQVILTAMVTLFLIGLVLTFMSLTTVSVISGSSPDADGLGNTVKAVTQIVFIGTQYLLIAEIPSIATTVGGAWTSENPLGKGLSGLKDKLIKKYKDGGAKP